MTAQHEFKRSLREERRPVGWFRAMGGDTVEYHRETVLERGDDHPGQALDYYGSRGETPLRWAGSAADGLGLSGVITAGEFDAAFAKGGFRHPVTGEKLVSTKRPGFEIVVSAHKTTAMLGVIGRADDMHAILDAETDHTMTWLDQWFQARGGRRGEAALPTPTTGLAWAQTRHGTSRAGDPNPHDHVLVLNIATMLDRKGGPKGLFSAALRDTVEAATMVGRLHAAAKAIELGYAIEADHGPSGRLRHWSVMGIPAEITELFSKRSDEITEYLAERGQSGYHARSVAARATRAVKRGTGIDELMPQWHAELEAAGWSVDRLSAALDTARRHWRPLAPELTTDQVDEIAVGLMAPDGEFLARQKVFSRTRLIAEVAPLLYGHDPAVLDRVIDRIIASPLVVPLIGLAGPREQPYSAVAVLASEAAIAERVDRLVDTPGPQLDPESVETAVAGTETRLGDRLSAGQRQAVDAVCSSGRAVDLIVGIAGSGKTTALDTAATALTSAGYQVLGTATSGQAARSLGAATSLDTRTMRSLLWHLDHRTLTLDARTVVILDEAGMTADADLGRLLSAVEYSSAKIILVGDDRQLSPVGPGGALAALIDAHPDTVTVLDENRRQRDPAEAAALLALRNGNVDAALEFYVTHNRISVTLDRTTALLSTVENWATNVAAGHDTLMLAWQKINVADLNRLARQRAIELGWVTGPELVTPDGRTYAKGDHVVTLAPNHDGHLVTSQHATVLAVNPHRHTMVIRTDDGRDVPLRPSDIGTDQLDHGYALTIHREQGDTTRHTERFHDGGGAELNYVALSRATHHTTIHIAADDLDQALNDLKHDLADNRADQWITTRATPGLDPLHTNTETRRSPARTTGRDRSAERSQAGWPAQQQPEPRDAQDDVRQLADAHRRLAQLDRRRVHLTAGTGPYEHTDIERAAQQLHQLDSDLAAAQRNPSKDRPWRRYARRRDLEAIIEARAQAAERWRQVSGPEAARLDQAIAATEHQVNSLEEVVHMRDRTWRRGRPLTADERTGKRIRADLLDEIERLQPDPTADGISRQLDAPGNPRPRTVQDDIEAARARLDRLETSGRPERDNGIGGLGM
jgi:conjugative relaxase-like TrwC/TraI family protein